MTMPAEDGRDESERAAAEGPGGEAAFGPDPRVVDLQDRLLRALADAENARKRAERARMEGRESGISDVVSALIPALDNLELALASAAEAAGTAGATGEPESSLLAGLTATWRSFLNGLEKFGVERIYPLGQRFDAAVHEAVAARVQPGTPPGEVIEVMQAGYRLGERLLRPARVVVSAADTSGPALAGRA